MPDLETPITDFIANEAPRADKPNLLDQPNTKADPNDVKDFNQQLRQSKAVADNKGQLQHLDIDLNSLTANLGAIGKESEEDESLSSLAKSLLASLGEKDKAPTTTEQTVKADYTSEKISNPLLPNSKETDVPLLKNTKDKDVPLLKSTKNEEVPLLQGTKKEETPLLNTTKDKDVPLLHTTKSKEVPLLRNKADKEVPLLDKKDALSLPNKEVPLLHDTQNPVQALPDTQTSGATILNNLQWVSQSNEIESHGTFQWLRTELVNRILVSSNALDNNQLVKITLSPQLLAGTEVNLQKQGQNLIVSFLVTNTQSESFLVNTQLDLQGYLSERLRNFQEISVSVNGQKAGEGASAQGQPQDGRSRNRFEYQAENENDDA